MSKMNYKVRVQLYDVVAVCFVFAMCIGEGALASEIQYVNEVSVVKGEVAALSCPFLPATTPETLLQLVWLRGVRPVIHCTQIEDVSTPRCTALGNLKGRFGLTVDATVGVLTINDVTPDDSGTYTCDVTTKGAIASKTDVELVVYDALLPASISASMNIGEGELAKGIQYVNEVSVAKGEVATLSCPFLPATTPETLLQLVWLRGDRTVIHCIQIEDVSTPQCTARGNRKGRFGLTVDAKFGVLTINDVTPDDGGTYTCDVTTKGAIASKTDVELVVYDALLPAPRSAVKTAVLCMREPEVMLFVLDRSSSVLTINYVVWRPKTRSLTSERGEATDGTECHLMVDEEDDVMGRNVTTLNLPVLEDGDVATNQYDVIGLRPATSYDLTVICRHHCGESKARVRSTTVADYISKASYLAAILAVVVILAIFIGITSRSTFLRGALRTLGYKIKHKISKFKNISSTAGLMGPGHVSISTCSDVTDRPLETPPSSSEKAAFNVCPELAAQSALIAELTRRTP